MKVNFVVSLAALIIIIGGVSFMFAEIRSRGLVEAVEELKNRKEKILNIDSLRSAIEVKILDSVRADLTRRDAEIEQLKKDIKTQRRKNEELTKLYYSLPVSMPEL
jgi:hypothetical protein